MSEFFFKQLFTRSSILVANSLVAHYSVEKMNRYSLQKPLAPKNHSALVSNSVRCYSLENLIIAKKSLVTRCKICSLLIAEVAHCKNLVVTCFKIPSLLVAEVARYLLTAEIWKIAFSVNLKISETLILF